MSEADLVELENYLFSEDKQEFLKRLIAGSESHNFFTLLTRLNEKGGTLNQTDLETFQSYMLQSNTPRKRNLEIRSLLLSYERAKEEKDRIIIMRSINSILSGFSWTHSQPTNITAKNLSIDEGRVSQSSSLKESLINRSNLLEGCLQSEYTLNEVEPRLYSHLSPKIIATQNENTMRQFLTSIDESLASMNEVPELIKTYREVCQKRIPGFEVEYLIFSKLSVKQIQELITLIPELSQNYQLIAEWFVKEFKFDSREGIAKEVGATKDRNTRKELIKEMMKWTNNLHQKFKSFYHQLHYELLVLGYETNEFDFELFYDYLQNPAAVVTGYNRTNIEQFSQRNFDNFWMNVHSCQIHRVGDNVLIQAYIDELFNKAHAKDDALDEKSKHFANDAYNNLLNFFDETYLRNLLYKTKLYRGEKVQFISEIFSSDQLQTINEEKILTICKHNKEFFVHGEDVKLELQIKNIPELIIKIFEFCPENYYIKTAREVDPNIVLDGLIAVQEEVHTFSQAPVIKFDMVFSFKRIQEKKQGIFIIEFIGNGICSRAVIKKGRLQLLSQVTVAGHVYRIIDENLDLCNGKRSGIWIQNTFYPVDSKTGEIIVPFTKKEGESIAIIVHEDFSSLFNIRLLKESYRFTCSYLYNNESLLTANTAILLIQPKLYAADNSPMSFNLIQDPVVTVTSMNDVGIPSTNTFDKIKLDHKEEICIQFPITAQVATINVKVTGQIKYMTDPDVKQELSSEYNITFDSKQGNFIFSHQNLRFTETGYEIYVLGKNGQPKSDVRLTINLTLDGFTSSRSQNLYTDKEGKVYLGDLKHVKAISSYINQKGDILAQSKNWFIHNMTVVNYPAYIKMLENEKVELPFVGKEINNKVLNLVRVSKTISGGYQSGFTIKSRGCSIISDEISKIKLQGSQLVLEGLQPGHYFLDIKDYNAQIEIDVIKGIKYQSDHSLVVTDNSILDLKKSSSFLFTDEIKVEQSKSEGANKEQYDLSLKVYSDNPDQTRVHIIAYNFVQSNINDLASTLISSSVIEQPTLIPLFNSRSVYMSNKTLGDEYRYVLDRKKQTVYVGNTLDKPQLLLKRTFKQDTSMQGQGVAEGTAFRETTTAPNDQALQQQIKNAEQSSYGRAINISNMQLNRVESYLNFLKYPSMLISNLKPDKDGVIELKNLSLGFYSSLQIITTNLYSTVTNMVPLPRNEVHFRDVTQMSNFQKDKFYSIFRSNGQIIENEQLVIGDLTSTEYQLVDSIPKLFSIQKELRKCFGADTEQTNGYDFWDFLQTWDSLEIRDKHKKYDKYACHELNIFIYCKDEAYFTNFVKPFISNQIQQTFVDFFLLRDDTQLYQYVSPSKIAELNPLQMILLIIFLKEVDQTETAKEIANLIDLKNQLITYDTKQFKKLFDTVLNAQTEESQEELEALMGDIYSNSNNNNNNMMNPMNMNMNANMNMNMNRPPPQMNVRMNMNRMVQQVQQVQQFQAPMPLNNMYAPQISNNVNNFAAFGPPHPSSAYAPPPPPHQSFGGQMYSNNMGMPQQQQQQQMRYQQEMMSNYNECDDFSTFESNAYDPYANNPGYNQARQGYVSQFRNVEKTKQYCERHYFQQINKNESIHLVRISQFWVDLAKHLTETVTQPFMSHNFMYLATNHTEMIAVLSFMSLPFSSKPNTYTQTEGKGIEIKASGNVVTFIKEIKEGSSELKPDILVSQRFYEPNDRYIYRDDDPSVKQEKEIKEFIIDRVYGCQVIVTNCSVSKHEFQVLVEVPEGSIPVHTNDYTKSHTLVLESFNTKTIDFYFYFPNPGKFALYPANVARFGTVVAVAKEVNFEVMLERTISNLETMQEILSKGSKDDILTFVRTQNILNSNIFKFTDVYYLLKDQEFYLKFIEILRKRKVYDEIAWSYSIYHGDHNSFIEYINNSNTINLISGQMTYFQNSIIEINPTRIFEYYPLVNARVHMLHQDQCNILNTQLRVQYKKFIQYLVEKYHYDLSDKLTLIYYLLIQDRIEESIKVFGLITEDDLKNGNGDGRLQFDYFTAYLDFYIGFPAFKKARAISERYLDYPVISWRNLFYDIANRLAEYDGEDKEQSKSLSEDEQAQQIKANNNQKKNQKNSEKEETLTIALDGTKIILTHQNLSKVEVSFYLIDLQVLFSRNPFLSQDSQDFSFVIPNERLDVELKGDDGLNKTQVLLPSQFQKTNVYIRVIGKSKRVSSTYFSNSLTMQIVENYGQVQVFDKFEKPVSRIYVKTFSKDKSGKVTFYQDGYTDLIGRFDYATTNSRDLENIQKFAIFVYSQELGSMIKEANPPVSLGRVEQQIELIGGKHKVQATQMMQAQQQTYATSHANISKKAWN